MEFKSLDSLSITECCEFLTKEMLLDALRHMSETTIQNQAYIEKIEMCLKGMADSRLCRTNLLSLAECSEQFKVKMETFFEAFSSSPDLTDHDRLIIRQLETLLKKERSDFEHCSTIEQYEKYLSDWNDGIHWDKATQQIVKLKAEAEELAFYKKNKNSIWGCKAYLQKYPKGRYVNDVQSILAQKKKARKTRNIVLLVALIIAVVVVCLINYKPNSEFNVSEEIILFGKKGGNNTLYISTNADEKNTDIKLSDLDWVNITSDDGTLYIDAEPNSESERTGLITIDTYSSFFGKRFNRKSKSVVVRQSSGLPTILSTNIYEISFDKHGNTRNNRIKAETDGSDLKVIAKNDWFTIEKMVDEKGDSLFAIINVKTSVNNYGERTGEIAISSANMTKRVKVFQESGLANCFELATSNLSIPEAGSDYNIKVNTDGTFWSVSSSPDWLTANANMLNNSLEISAASNNGQRRDGTIVLKSNNGDIKSITVTQQGDPTNFGASTNYIEFSSRSGNKNVEIKNDSDKRITTSCDVSWISVSIVNKNRIKISCQQNDGDYSRSAYVNVKCGNETTSIRVTQSGDVANLRAEKGSVKFGTSSDYSYVTINNNSRKTLTVQENLNWVSVSVINKNKVKISCTSNSNERRSGTVYIYCGSERVSVTVKQDGWTDCRHCGGRRRFQCAYPALWGAGGYHYVQNFVMNYYTGGGYYVQEPCPNCGGRGTVDCSYCGGRGRIKSTY